MSLVLPSVSHEVAFNFFFVLVPQGGDSVDLWRGEGKAGQVRAQLCPDVDEVCTEEVREGTGHQTEVRARMRRESYSQTNKGKTDWELSNYFKKWQRKP